MIEERDLEQEFAGKCLFCCVLGRPSVLTWRPQRRPNRLQTTRMKSWWWKKETLSRSLLVSVCCPRFCESVGTSNLILQSVCLSVRLSVTKTLSLAITFALLHVELWYLACVFFVTRPFRWYHVMTFDILQGQICCQAGDHNSLYLLVLLCAWVACKAHLVATMKTQQEFAGKFCVICIERPVILTWQLEKRPQNPLTTPGKNWWWKNETSNRSLLVYNSLFCCVLGGLLGSPGSH